MAGGRCDIDDRAGTTLDHARDERLAHQDRADEISVQQSADVFELHLQRIIRVWLAAFRADVAAGGVDQNSDGPERAFDVAGDRGHR